MELEAARVGTRVRVQLDYRKPRRRGAVGTIKKRYGIPEYTAFEVLFADGQRELFWDHQLEEAKESSPKGRWVFSVHPDRKRSRSILLALATAFALALVAAGCSGSNYDTSAPSQSSEATQDTVTAQSEGDFAGLVDIGGGRKIYMECSGTGSPTVVFVSGGGDRTETWSKTLDPSQQPVLPAIVKTNRVCAYDRPGTILSTGEGDFEPSRSDPVVQPTTLQDGVADLHALLSASGERGPYIVVGHSVGGAITELYASEYPQDVSGLVLVDYTPYELRNGLTDEEWNLWVTTPLSGKPSEEDLALYPDLERFDHQRNLEEVLAAAPLKPMPLIVLSSDEPYDFAPLVDSGEVPADIADEFAEDLFQAVMDARAGLVSQVPGAEHITDTDSGHYIHQKQPELVIDAIRQVADAATDNAKTEGVVEGAK